MSALLTLVVVVVRGVARVRPSLNSTKQHRDSLAQHHTAPHSISPSETTDDDYYEYGDYANDDYAYSSSSEYNYFSFLLYSLRHHIALQQHRKAWVGLSPPFFLQDHTVLGKAHSTEITTCSTRTALWSTTTHVKAP
jgi:hypothetical protein